MDLIINNSGRLIRREQFDVIPVPVINPTMQIEITKDDIGDVPFIIEPTEEVQDKKKKKD